jgi:hypothetical protein
VGENILDLYIFMRYVVLIYTEKNKNKEKETTI